MRFSSTPIRGAFEVVPEPRTDERGFFARSWCAREFEDNGLPPLMVQASISQNDRRGTLRGMHFQWPPSVEGKLVRCEQGSVHDVILDLRPDSHTFLEHVVVVLDSARANGVYVPPGCAHGFQTLEDDTRVLYLMTDFYAPDLSDGVPWDDPAFGISWPLAVTAISARDSRFAPFDREAHGARYRRAGAGS